MDDEVTARVIDAAIRSLPEGATKEVVAAATKAYLKEAGRVAAEWARIRAAEKAMHDRHAAEWAEKVGDPAARMRSSCPHTARRHYPDPAGGSDGYTSCLLCGAEV